MEIHRVVVPLPHAGLHRKFKVNRIITEVHDGNLSSLAKSELSPPTATRCEGKASEAKYRKRGRLGNRSDRNTVNELIPAPTGGRVRNQTLIDEPQYGGSRGGRERISGIRPSTVGGRMDKIKGLIEQIPVRRCSDDRPKGSAK